MNHLSLCQRKLNEDIVDYDLLKDLVCYIDETYPEGTILVFLTGKFINLILIYVLILFRSFMPAEERNIDL